MIDRSTNIRSALRSRQRGFMLNPYRFGTASGDPYFANVGFLLHFDSPVGANNPPDSGPRNKTFTRGGTGAGSMSTAQSVFGGASWTAPTTVGSLTTPQDTTYITASGSTPWTWECRYRPDAFGAAKVLFDCNNSSSNTTGWQIYVGTDGKLYIYSGPQALSYGGYGTAMSTVTWYALRITWDGTTLYFFKDGVLLGSTTGFTNVWGNSVNIANSSFVSQGMTGYMDECRWTKGVARSTATYTVDVAAFPNF